MSTQRAVNLKVAKSNVSTAKIQKFQVKEIMHKVIYMTSIPVGYSGKRKGSDAMVLMDEEDARLEGDCLPGEDAPITWDDDYMQGREMRSLL